MTELRKYGWRPDKPDPRDYRMVVTMAESDLPARVDLRPQMPPVYDQGSLGSCHDDETEVLTRRGWLRFEDTTLTDEFASVDPDTSRLIFEHPSRIVKLPYIGELVAVSRRTVDFRVTPDHRMLVRKWNEAERTLNSNYEFVPAGQLGWCAGLLNRVVWQGCKVDASYTLPGVEHKRRAYRTDLVVPMSAWLRFLGIYLAEGTMLNRDQCSGRISYKIQIAASKERERTFIRETFFDLGIHALELSDRFTFEDKRIYEELSRLGLEGVKAPFKFVPAFVFDLPADQIRELLLGHFSGDGSSTSDGHRSHYTSSWRLADDLQRLVFMSGDEAYLTSRSPRTSVMKDGRIARGKYPEFRVGVCENKNLSLERKSDIEAVPYKGYVYCAEVPTYHTLVTRRHGRILVSGNCTANAAGAAHQFNQTKQGSTASFCPSRLFTYFNTRMLEDTVEEDAGAMIRTAMKTLERFGACPETMWPYDTAKFRVQPPQPCYTEAEKHQAVRYMRVNQQHRDIRACLAAGYPVVFGFTVYRNFDDVGADGMMQMPAGPEDGGHAVMLVGYDDASKRYIVRNSWGERWGDHGYFYMPYAYCTDRGLSADFWTIRTVEV